MSTPEYSSFKQRTGGIYLLYVVYLLYLYRWYLSVCLIEIDTFLSNINFKFQTEHEVGN